MDFAERYTKSRAQQIAELERYRSRGWLPFTATITLVGSLAALAFAYFTFGMGWIVRLNLPVQAVGLLFAFSQVLWWIIPGTIECLGETDARRRAQYREGGAIWVAGLFAALVAGILPLRWGLATYGVELMLAISGVVLAAWGASLLYRYWTSHPKWPATSSWQKIVRLYAQCFVIVLLAVASLVRVHAYYGDAPWAEPVRRMIGP
ncbi:MAG: hypothetical protein AMXMBFR7_36740 [Planctomycetota bacterium]